MLSLTSTLHCRGSNKAMQPKRIHSVLLKVQLSDVKKKNSFVYLSWIVSYLLESCVFPLNAPTLAHTNTSSNMQYIYVLRRPCEISQQNHIDLIEEASFIICCFHKKPFKTEIFWKLIAPSPDPTVVGGDTLTCGECKKDFRLQELTLFIQHKALNTCRYFSCWHSCTEI